MNLLTLARGAARAALAHPAVRLAIAGGVIAWGIQELSAVVEETKAEIVNLAAERDELGELVAKMSADIASAQDLLIALRKATDDELRIPRPRDPVEMTVQRIDPGGIVGEPVPISLADPDDGTAELSAALDAAWNATRG